MIKQKAKLHPIVATKKYSPNLIHQIHDQRTKDLFLLFFLLFLSLSLSLSLSLLDENEEGKGKKIARLKNNDQSKSLQ